MILPYPLPGLSPIDGKGIVARFDGGRLSSDGGLLVLREIERRLAIADRPAACIDDPRHPHGTVHTLADIIRFRLLMIAAGYAGVVQPSDVRTSKRGHLLVAQRREEGMIQEPPMVASGPFLPLGLDVLDQPLFGDLTYCWRILVGLTCILALFCRIAAGRASRRACSGVHGAPCSPIVTPDRRLTTFPGAIANNVRLHA